MTEQAEARAVCEHFYASHCYRGMSIRLCMTCHEPDWDDLAEQLAASEEKTPAAPGSCGWCRDPYCTGDHSGDVAAGEAKAPAVPSPPVAAALGPVEELRRIADQDIGGNAPWLADKLHAFAGQLAAEMRGECQMDPPADAALDREHLGRIVHETRLACEAERAALEGRQRFNLGPWERRAYEQQETDRRTGEAVAAAVQERSEEKEATP